MRSRLVKVGLLCVAFVLAVGITLLSVLVERTGPELVPYGNLCGPSQNEPCYKPVLKGGFPVSYLLDAPGVSRERQLAFIEDTLHPGAFALDIAVYFGAILLVSVVAWRAWFVYLRSPNHADAFQETPRK